VQSFASKKRQYELCRYGLVRNLYQKQQNCTATATEAEKVCKTITDYAIKHFHFSNLKRSPVIKVRCRAEICSTFADIYMLSCLQLLFQLAADNYCNYREARWPDCLCAEFRGERSGLESGWQGALCFVIGQGNLLSQCLSLPRCTGQRTSYVLGINLPWTSFPSRGKNKYIPSRFMLQKLGLARMQTFATHPPT